MGGGDDDEPGGFQALLRQYGGGSALKQLRDANRLGNNKEIADAVEREEFEDDIQRLRKRLADQKRGLLDPRGTFVQCWDMVTTVSLVYTMFVTPFEVGLDLQTAFDKLFVCNVLIGIIFSADVVIQFVLPVPLKGTQLRGESAFERRHWKLAQRYLTSWFLIDVVTVIPFDVLVWQGVFSGEVKMIKILRVLRLLKLVKVLRASSIIQRWENSFAIQSTKQTLGGFAFGTIVLLHWMACSWALLASLSLPQRLGSEQAIANEMLTMMSTQDGCTGCFPDDPSTAEFCASPCLTACERSAAIRPSLPCPRTTPLLRAARPVRDGLRRLTPVWHVCVRACVPL